LVPTIDQATMGMVNTSANTNRLRMSRAIESIDMPAWPPWPWPWACPARSIAAWSWAAGAAPCSAIGSHTWPGTDWPAQCIPHSVTHRCSFSTEVCVGS
jgi:hypothetical protein